VLCGVIGLVGFFVPAVVNIEQNYDGHAVAGREALLAARVHVAE